MNDEMLIAMKSLQTSYNLINLVDRVKAMDGSMPLSVTEFTKEFDDLMSCVRQLDILESLPSSVAIAELADSIKISLSLPRKKWLKIIDDAKQLPDVRAKGIQLELDLKSAQDRVTQLMSTLDNYLKEINELKVQLVLLTKKK